MLLTCTLKCLPLICKTCGCPWSVWGVMPVIKLVPIPVPNKPWLVFWFSRVIPPWNKEQQTENAERHWLSGKKRKHIDGCVWSFKWFLIGSKKVLLDKYTLNTCFKFFLCVFWPEQQHLNSLSFSPTALRVGVDGAPGKKLDLGNCLKFEIEGCDWLRLWLRPITELVRLRSQWEKSFHLGLVIRSSSHFGKAAFQVGPIFLNIFSEIWGEMCVKVILNRSCKGIEWR